MAAKSSERQDGVSAPYAAYAVTQDGSRRALDGCARLVVDLGVGEIEIELTVPHSVLASQLRISAGDDRILVVGHGDASSIYVGTERFRGARSKAK